MPVRSRSDIEAERNADQISDLEDEVRDVRGRVEDLRVGQERQAAQLTAHAQASTDRHTELTRRLDEMAQRGDGLWLPSRVVVGIILAVLAALGLGVGVGAGEAAGSAPAPARTAPVGAVGAAPGP